MYGNQSIGYTRIRYCAGGRGVVMSNLVPQKIEKYAAETFFIGGDISQVKEVTEIITLVGSSVIAVDKTGQISDVIDGATLELGGSTVLKARLSGGTAKMSPYVITFYMKTSEDNLWGVRFEVTVI